MPLSAFGSWGTAWVPGGKRAIRGEHRTEVTEATEDGFWVLALNADPLPFRARNTRIRESIAQRSQRPQRRILGFSFKRRSGQRRPADPFPRRPVSPPIGQNVFADYLLRLQSSATPLQL
jgi:hypothetical protein